MLETSRRREKRIKLIISIISSQSGARDAAGAIPEASQGVKPGSSRTDAALRANHRRGPEEKEVRERSAKHRSGLSDCYRRRKRLLRDQRQTLMPGYLLEIRNTCALSSSAARGKGVGSYLPLRQVSEAGHGGQAAEDPRELGVLRDLRGQEAGVRASRPGGEFTKFTDPRGRQRSSRVPDGEASEGRQAGGLWCLLLYRDMAEVEGDSPMPPSGTKE